jgi:transcriptional regulator with XRE-family HTH domain
MSQLLDTIGDAIRKSDKTPAEIARDAGIAKSQLSRLLSGERGLSVNVLERLARALGLEIVVRPKSRRKGR